MDEYVVRESKVALFVGLIGTVVFLALYIPSMFYAVRYCASFGIAAFFTLVFGGLSSLGIYLIVSYFRRKLTINGTRISYTPAFGSTKTFSSNDIQVITLDITTSVRLRSQEGKRLACFELNMPGSCAALSYLESQGIPLTPSSQLAKRLSESQRQGSSRAESFRREEQDYILSKWSENRISMEKRAVRILHFLMIILLITSLVIVQTQKIMLGCLVFIPLFCYGMYLFFYPKMTLDTNIVKTYPSCRIPFPAFVCGIDVIFLILFLSRLNMQYFIFALIYGLFLFILYLLVLFIRKRKERIPKILLVLFAAFFLAVVTSPALNVAATFRSGEHTTVTVLDKKTHHSSKSGDDYQLTVRVHEETQTYTVSEKLYDSVEINDPVILCRRKSIFGVKWIVLHN